MSAPAPGCYAGRRATTGTMVTRPDGTLLELEPSLEVWRYSPAGFEWGFQGSGPAQLALALLLDHTGDREAAQTHHQRFKTDVVARWRGKEWALEPREIDAWLTVTAPGKATE